MNLEATSVVLRERNAWEACDLGIRLAVRCWGRIVVPLLLVSVPPWLVLSAAVQGAPWLAPLAVWWLKPLFERVPLAVISKELFGKAGNAREVLRELRWPAPAALAAQLTWLRPVPWRSFGAAVEQLEGQQGGARRRRLGVLLRAEAGPALFLTLVGMTAELTAMLSFYVFINALMPPGFEIELTVPDFAVEVPVLEALLFSGVAFAIQTLVMPFYVAGFCLYIKRRIDLEGWDLELAFRRMRDSLDERHEERLAG